ncbi:MAG: hypothetical protein ABWZ99_09310 [Ilumatobacteraceae bacterium]
MASWFQRELVDTGRLPMFVCFAAFVVTFVSTRVVTRMIRADRGPFKNNVSTSGLHVHHAVPGIILLITGAFAALAVDVDSGWSIVAGLLVGVGTSLVLDEFALILHRQDVYWSDEGRISVEMVSLAVGCMGLVLVGYGLFELDDDGAQGVAVLATVVGVGVNLLWIVLCVTKGKYKLALFSVFVPLVGFLGAVRLARPDSRWARHRYPPKKQARAAARAARYDRRFGPATDWVSDFVAGKPSQPDPPPPSPPAATGPPTSASARTAEIAKQ